MKRIVWIFVLIAGCKQGKGDRCQIQADCPSDLICSQKGTCDTTGGNEFDASVPDGPRVDAPRPDATPADAALGG